MIFSRITVEFKTRRTDERFDSDRRYGRDLGTLVIFYGNGSAACVWYSKQKARTVLSLSSLSFSHSLLTSDFKGTHGTLSIGLHGRNRTKDGDIREHQLSGLLLIRLGSLLPKGLTKGQAEKEKISTPPVPLEPC
jgi:hypothetical protein